MLIRASYNIYQQTPVIVNTQLLREQQQKANNLFCH